MNADMNNVELLAHLQKDGQGISFVPPSWGYPACPNCSGGELVEVRTNEGLTRVLCYDAFGERGCNYIAPAKECAG